MYSQHIAKTKDNFYLYKGLSIYYLFLIKFIYVAITASKSFSGRFIQLDRLCFSRARILGLRYRSTESVNLMCSGIILQLDTKLFVHIL